MKTKLAVMVDFSGKVPLGGNHYMLFPKKLGVQESEIFRLMGYEIIEVDEIEADRLIDQAGAALNHQVEVAVLVETQKKNGAQG